MLRIEDNIRDYLADHLDLIEVGLTFVKKEFPIKNSTGAGGRIDILAKDRYNQFVIIEIKRSDQAARQALNELHKYAALFRLNQGLDEKNVRLMVISTEWHELLLPLAEFSANTRYHVEGVRIDATDDGVVTNASLVDLAAPLEGSEQLKVCRYHEIFLFKDRSRREVFQVDYHTEFKDIGVEDFFFIHCDYHGSNKAVIYPCGLYICMSSPLDNLNLEQQELLKLEFEWDPELDPLEQNFFAALHEPKDREYDNFEIGYPEKLSGLSSSWTLLMSERHGRLSGENSLLTDDDLIKLAMAVEGGSSVYYGKTGSPKFKAPWQELRKNLIATLEGYPSWQSIVPCVLDEIQTISANSTVSVISYTPANFLLSLYSLDLRNDFKYIPYLEINIDDPDRGEVRSLFSFAKWDGKVLSEMPDQIIGSIYEDLFEWAMETQFGGTDSKESKMLTSHGLKLVLIEVKDTEDKNTSITTLSTRKNRLKRSPFDMAKVKSIKDFKDMNQEYISELTKLVDKYASGLRDNLT